MQNFTASEPWPRVTVKQHTAAINYDTASMRVELLREEDPVSAIRADELMGRASRQILEGLSRFDRAGGATGGDGEALRLVADGMKSAHEAFLVWSLVPGKVQRELEDLQRRGALAVKLTGAGGGGFLVALWP